MPKKNIKRIIRNKADSLAKMVGPKLVTALYNILRLGPRMILRSSIELLRANLITRILSCITLLILDIIDFARHRISKVQFIRNLILSGLLVAGGTLGWNLGTRWIAIEIFGALLEIIGGIIGASVLGFFSNLAIDKLFNRLIKSDSQKMWEILNQQLEKFSEKEQKYIREHITPSQLKKMFASKDKDIYAKELIALHINESIQRICNTGEDA